MNKILVLIICLFSLSGCIYISENKMIFDDNKKIVEEGDMYTYIDRIGEVLDDGASLEVKGFYGTDTIYTFDSIEELSITVTQVVQKGKFKVVLINPENEIIILNGTTSITLSVGKYRIKLVGENAYATLDINIDKS